MKGVIFDLLQQVVVSEHGDQAWDGLLEASGLEGAYTAVGSYPDEELLALVRTACDTLGVARDDLLRWFGRECIPLLAERYPAFFTPHKTTRDFLMTLNDVIHPEVRKLFPGAYAPSFEFTFPSEDSIALGYRSHRDLCMFAEGLIEGSAAWYRESVQIQQPSCTSKGDDRCILMTTTL